MIKKHYKLIILIIIIFLIFIIYKKNHINYFNYTSLGDGYALGINSYGESDYGYSDFIKDEYKTKKKLGLYTKDFSNKDQSISNLYQKLLINEKLNINKKELNLKHTIRESNLITMSIGLNDLIYYISITDNINESKLNKIVIKISNDLDKLINEIKRYYPKKVYIIGYPNINIKNKYVEQGIIKLNQMFSKNENIVYIPTDELLTNSDFLNPNSIYPSKKGYYKIAKEVLKTLAKEENN